MKFTLYFRREVDADNGKFFRYSMIAFRWVALAMPVFIEACTDAIVVLEKLRDSALHCM